MKKLAGMSLAVCMAFGLCLGVSGCATTRDADVENSPEEIAAAQQVFRQLSKTLGDAYASGAAYFEMGALDGGCAVLLVHVNQKPLDAGFWTSGETVHAVNEAARAMDSSLPDAPEAITLKRVRAVVH